MKYKVWFTFRNELGEDVVDFWDNNGNGLDIDDALDISREMKARGHKDVKVEEFDTGARFRSVCPEYTGGGVYVFTGQLNDGNYFMADTGHYAVDVYNADPVIPDDMPDDEAQRIYGVTRDEDAWGSVEWQEEHLVRWLDLDESVEFFKSMFQWIRDNKPCGNYLVSDLPYFEEELQKLNGNWR